MNKNQMILDDISIDENDSVRNSTIVQMDTK